MCKLWLWSDERQGHPCLLNWKFVHVIIHAWREMDLLLRGSPKGRNQGECLLVPSLHLLQACHVWAVDVLHTGSLTHKRLVWFSVHVMWRINNVGRCGGVKSHMFFTGSWSGFYFHAKQLLAYPRDSWIYPSLQSWKQKQLSLPSFFNIWFWKLTNIRSRGQSTALTSISGLRKIRQKVILFCLLM